MMSGSAAADSVAGAVEASVGLAAGEAVGEADVPCEPQPVNIKAKDSIIARAILNSLNLIFIGCSLLLNLLSVALV